VKEYRVILEWQDISYLERSIERYLNGGEGWQLQGGVAAIANPEGTDGFAQAIVRDVPS
jgi:hypothetical protein